MIEQGGAIVFRGEKDSPEVLLVRAKKNPSHWVFPKGHIAGGEKPADTARRELREEAGVIGQLAGKVGALTFELERRYHVTYFAFLFNRMTEADEEREIRWCSVDEALGLLAFENARQLLLKAREIIDAQHVR
jgi:8-oxo-dGTP pyrophosphatase MutT (NUDIX family)